MKLAVAFILAIVCIGAGHSGHQHVNAGLPKVIGGRAFFSELNGLSPFHLSPAPAAQISEQQPSAATDLKTRQNPSNTCGPGIGGCGPKECCSLYGFCGVGKDYCTSPDCQFLYGPGTLFFPFLSSGWKLISSSL